MSFQFESEEQNQLPYKCPLDTIRYASRDALINHLLKHIDKLQAEVEKAKRK